MKYYSNSFRLPLFLGSFLLIIIFLLSGCKLMSRLIWQVKPPKVESLVTLNKYLTKNEYDTSKLLLFKNLESYSKFSKEFNMGIPEAYFVNSSGELIDYKKTPDECNAGIDKFLIDLEQINNIHPDNTVTLNSLNELFKNPIETKNEITVFLTWAVFIGKVNTSHSKEWVELLNKAESSGLKLKYYLLNCDILDTWGVDPEEFRKDSKKALKEGMKKAE